MKPVATAWMEVDRLFDNLGKDIEMIKRTIKKGIKATPMAYKTLYIETLLANNYILKSLSQNIYGVY